MTDMMRDLLATLRSGQPVTPAQQRWVLETHDLVQLGTVATELRGDRLGRQGTFVRVDTVPLAEAATWQVAPDAGEVRLAGVPDTLDTALGAVRALAGSTGGSAAVPVTGFTVHDLALAAGPNLREWCEALREAGLAAIAHARTDRLEDGWLSAIAAAGLTVQALAPGAPAEGEAWLDGLEQVRTWQRACNVIGAYQPLPLDVAADAPSTGYDDMRAVAGARILLDNVVHIQVDWARAGAKLAQACLLFGADDVDAVPARDDMPHGPRRSILEEVRRNFEAVALTPVERTAAFDAPVVARGAELGR